MRFDQPSGEVTLVFTDIEGSTRLLHELGTAAYREALGEHCRIVRGACARYSGYEVDYEGDAFFYAFSSAEDAVAAVSEAMEGLQEGPIAIRVGIHTGSPEPDPPKYVGLDVHTAARIMSAGHGGQVVVSPTTAVLVDVSLTELGEHRLEDLPEPIALYQLGDGSFPPLKTISNTNLPRPASSFVGRDAELGEVLSRIESGARLLTLTGPGGTGKTRLGVEAAATLVPQYKAGVFWVGLASLRDPALVTETIARTLGSKDGLAEHISERELLLLLDNLEQVIDCAPELSSLLSACPNLTLLVTSRERLRVQGEVEYAVPPLAEPEAVDLFCARSGLEPSTEIAELCARLDSLPLAVELAAARTKALTVSQILERLTGRLDLLKGGRDADPRQLRRRHAAWFLALAEDSRDEMQDQSRQLVIAKLEQELANLRVSLSWFRSAEDSTDELRLLRALSKFWLARDHMAEGESVLAEALARIPDDGSELRMRVELALGEIAMRRDKPDIARSSVERWLVWAREEGGPSDVAWALSSLASICMRKGDFAGSVLLLDEALETARSLADTRLLSNVAGNLGYALSAVGEYERAAELCRESIELAPTASDVCVDYANLGLALLGLGDLDGAGSEYRRAIVGSFASGYFFTLADAMVGAAAIAFRRGASDSAIGVLAAVDRLRADFGLPADPVEHDLAVRTSEAARAALATEEIELAWNTGDLLGIDAAVRYALASID